MFASALHSLAYPSISLFPSLFLAISLAVEISRSREHIYLWLAGWLGGSTRNTYQFMFAFLCQHFPLNPEGGSSYVPPHMPPSPHPPTRLKIISPLRFSSVCCSKYHERKMDGYVPLRWKIINFRTCLFCFGIKYCCFSCSLPASRLAATFVSPPSPPAQPCVCRKPMDFEPRNVFSRWGWGGTTMVLLLPQLLSASSLLSATALSLVVVLLLGVFLESL